MARLHIEDHLPRERWDEMAGFLAQQYRPGYVLRQRPLFEWQFRDAGRAGSARVLCAYAGDRLVGMLGCIVVNLLWGDPAAPVQGVWTANWMVAGEHRHGVGWLLIRRAQELFPILLGQGANPANQAVTAKLGYQLFPEIPRYVAVLNAHGTEPLVSPTSSASARAALARELHMTGASGAWRLTDAGQLAEYRPDFRLYPALRFGTLRDAGYLRWRYLEHPSFEYGVALAGAPERPAVCVFRRERTSGAAELTVGRIVELFAPEDARGERDAGAALAHALDALSQGGAVFADFYCTSRSVGALVQRLGFSSLENGALASRLNPVELGAHAQNLQLWVAPGLPRPAALGDLYVTRSDGDQDRPNA
jgi:hypothetical protein